MKLPFQSIRRNMQRWLIITVIVLPVTVGLPIIFFLAWSQAVEQAHSGGGMFYFPATWQEALAISLFFLSALPWVGTTLLVGIPVEFALLFLGVEAQLAIPLPNGQVQVSAGFVVGLVVGIIVQAIVYSIPICIMYTNALGVRR